jgi:hypothetical protein
MAERICRCERVERGKMGERGGFQTGFPSFISPDGHGLGCTGIGCDWASWAALWGGIVH